MRKSYLLAIFVLLALGAWLYSGSIVVGGRGDTEVTIAEAQDAPGNEAIQRVAVERVTAQMRQAALLLRGRTQAEDRVDVRAETEGAIEELGVAKGDHVKAGDLLCRIDTRTRAAHLAQARAQLAQADADYEAARKLAENGYAAETRVRTLKAQRDAAMAAVEAADWDMKRTEIVAPISGIVEKLDVRLGSLLRAGDTCAGIVDTDPMLAIAQVSERELAGVRKDVTATVNPVTGGSFAGKVSYIAPAADPDTRTFRVEITLDNASGALRDGVTTTIDIPLPEQKAHFFRSSVLVLRDDGTVGVRAVDGDNKVVFHTVKLLADQADGVWVAGLPDVFDLIVAGQDYVAEGATVEPVMQTAEAKQ
ncbi:MAG: efflux RND transporter periplasmic adaptor subunit [Rhodobiaceae bacterium]|nr:efflux RND transporter periplasmic adaptor subunit [Rhodobiaceae bacterium]